MPSFGGRLEAASHPRSASKRTLANIFLALGALGLVFSCICFAVYTTNHHIIVDLEKHSDNRIAKSSGPPDTDSEIAKMQVEVKEQLAEAAKRRALAKKHREQAKKLAADASVDRTAAQVLRRKAAYSHSEKVALAKQAAVRLAESRVQAFKAKAQALNSAALADDEAADKLKEDVSELDDKAADLDEEAKSKESREGALQTSAQRAASSLPILLKQALSTEARAAKLKRAAQARMADSTVKMERARSLDARASKKERQAAALRAHIIDNLEKKAEALERQQKEEAAATEAASAESAELSSASKSTQLEASDSVQASAEDEALPKDTFVHHKILEGRRRTNLLKSAMATRRIRGARGRVAEPDPADAPPLPSVGHGTDEAAPVRTQGLAQGPTVTENEEGHLAVSQGEVPRPTTARMVEDGHFSEREETFKRALAAAQTGAAPAALLQKGPGEASELEPSDAAAKSLAAAAASGPVFTKLWYDPDSLPAVTHELAGTTAHLARYAPRDAEEARTVVNTQELYEDGHVSRSEQAFNNEMAKYRRALEEQRQADLAHARRASHELEQLPGGPNTAELAAQRGDDFQSERKRATVTMLSEPQNHWDASGAGAYTKMQQAGLAGFHVTEDDDGRLVVDDGRNAALDEFEGGERDRRRRPAELRPRRRDEGGEARETELELSSSRPSRLARLQEELRMSLAREDHLERRTDRLEGEVEALREDHPRRERHFEEGRRRRDDELREPSGGREDMLAERRRRREPAEARREEARALPPREAPPPAAAVKAGQSGGRFRPDETYEKEYARDPGHVSVGEMKFQHALKQFDQTKAMLRAGAQVDSQHFHLPQLIPSHLPGQGL